MLQNRITVVTNWHRRLLVCERSGSKLGPAIQRDIGFEGIISSGCQARVAQFGFWLSLFEAFDDQSRPLPGGLGMLCDAVLHLNRWYLGFPWPVLGTPTTIFCPIEASVKMGRPISVDGTIGFRCGAWFGGRLRMHKQ